MHCVGILFRCDGRPRPILVSEGRGLKDGFAIEGESENAAPARLDGAGCGYIHKPGGTTPPGHDRHVLDSIDGVSDRCSL
jgi:hypothetical protein